MGSRMMKIDTFGVIQMTPDDLIGQSVAILGIKGSGKSNTAAVLMEELLTTRIPICVVDIAGEYHTLKDEYEHISIIGRSITTQVDVPLSRDNVRDVAQKVYINGLSVVVDVSGIDSDARGGLLHSFFTEIWRQSAVYRIPQIIFLEECHNWIPQGRRSTAIRDLFIDIAAEGRKRGLSLVMVGQRSARIHKDTLTQADISFLHRVRHPTDLKVYIDMIPRQGRWIKDRVFKLKTGEALVLLGEQVLRAQMRLQRTQHIGATPTVANIPIRQLSLLDLLECGSNLEAS